MDKVYDFGQILQKLRKEKGLTQEQLANRIHKESSIISRYEKNLQSPTFETVRAFAAIFNVSMDYLSGTEKSSTVSTTGLTAAQADIIKELTAAFAAKNTAVKRELTKEQNEIIGRIVAEFYRQ